MAIDPSEDQRTDLRQTFDREALRYHRARPGYPEPIFDLIAEAGKFDPKPTVLEVGAGTGQATRSMAARDWQITAVELGASLAEVGRSALAEFDTVEFIAGDIETLQLPLGQFDAVVAFTCFHWLNPDTRSRRLASLLRPGGLLAVVDTHHINNSEDDPSQEFFEEVQTFYDRWMGPTDRQRLLTSDQVAPRLPLLDHPNLEPLTEHRFEHYISYTTEEYVDVLETYSNHLALGASNRESLLTEIADCINDNYGGMITKRHLYTVALARRRHNQPFGQTGSHEQ